jgi:hypothetical protein
MFVKYGKPLKCWCIRLLNELLSGQTNRMDLRVEIGIHRVTITNGKIKRTYLG